MTEKKKNDLNIKQEKTSVFILATAQEVLLCDANWVAPAVAGGSEQAEANAGQPEGPGENTRRLIKVNNI